MTAAFSRDEAQQQHHFFVSTGAQALQDRQHGHCIGSVLVVYRLCICSERHSAGILGNRGKGNGDPGEHSGRGAVVGKGSLFFGYHEELTLCIFSVRGAFEWRSRRPRHQAVLSSGLWHTSFPCATRYELAPAGQCARNNDSAGACTQPEETGARYSERKLTGREGFCQIGFSRPVHSVCIYNMTYARPFYLRTFSPCAIHNRDSGQHRNGPPRKRQMTGEGPNRSPSLAVCCLKQRGWENHVSSSCQTLYPC